MKKILIILTTAVILFSADLFSGNKTWSKTGYKYWYFRIQPYYKTKIFINNKRVYPRFIKRNNNIATLRLALKPYYSESGFKLTL
jgi:hypothetical protein